MDSEEEVDDEVTDAEAKVVAELEIAALQEEIESVQSGMLKGVMLDTSNMHKTLIYIYITKQLFEQLIAEA